MQSVNISGQKAKIWKLEAGESKEMCTQLVVSEVGLCQLCMCMPHPFCGMTSDLIGQGTQTEDRL